MDVIKIHVSGPWYKYKKYEKYKKSPRQNNIEEEIKYKKAYKLHTLRKRFPYIQIQEHDSSNLSGKHIDIKVLVPKSKANYVMEKLRNRNYVVNSYDYGSVFTPYKNDFKFTPSE